MSTYGGIVMKYSILDPEKQKAHFSKNIGEISPFDAGVPLFECSDDTITEIYYYRWHSFCKHIRKTPEGHVVTEFYPPVPWAKKYNTINCPASHHLYEGRWLHEGKYIADYIRFWFSDPDAEPRQYSFPAADSVYAVCKVKGDFSLAIELYDKLKENYFSWEKTHLRENGMFYQIDSKDGMEYSAGGSGIRPTINSYMYADAVAISKIAKILGKTADAAFFEAKAATLKENINTLLWDDNAQFFKTLAEKNSFAHTSMREEIGYVPWCYCIPDGNKGGAWKFLFNEKHFAAPYGPTTAEQCCPEFMKTFDHECLWNGPSWPFATSQTLTALANYLCDYENSESYCDKKEYQKLLFTYANSQYDTLSDGSRMPYVDENLDPFTGEWLARKLLLEMEIAPGGTDRGADYNHSTYCDLVLSGLCGIRANESNDLVINPLFDEETTEYLCADGVLYHGHYITVVWDKSGKRYGIGRGLSFLCDGKMLVHTETCEKTNIKL